MAFSNTAGYTWADGEVVTATKLNSAGLPTIANGQTYGFGSGSAGAPSLSFSAEATLGFYRYAAGVVGLVGNISAINAVVNTQLMFGQDSTHNLNFLWSYDATAANALATIGTFGKTNDLYIQGKNLYFDSSALAGALEIFTDGRVRVGAGANDGINALQVVGSTVSDMVFSNPTTLTYAASTAINFFTNDTQTETLTGNVTFTTSNKVSGRCKFLRIICDGTPRTFTFPAGWVFMNNTAPTGIAASKTAVLTLQCFGTADTDIVAAYVVQP